MTKTRLRWPPVVKLLAEGGLFLDPLPSRESVSWGAIRRSWASLPAFSTRKPVHCCFPRVPKAPLSHTYTIPVLPFSLSLSLSLSLSVYLYPFLSPSISIPVSHLLMRLYTYTYIYKLIHPRTTISIYM